MCRRPVGRAGSSRTLQDQDGGLPGPSRRDSAGCWPGRRSRHGRKPVVGGRSRNGRRDVRGTGLARGETVANGCLRRFVAPLRAARDRGKRTSGKETCQGWESWIPLPRGYGDHRVLEGPREPHHFGSAGETKVSARPDSSGARYAGSGFLPCRVPRARMALTSCTGTPSCWANGHGSGSSGSRSSGGCPAADGRWSFRDAENPLWAVELPDTEDDKARLIPVAGERSAVRERFLANRRSSRRGFAPIGQGTLARGIGRAKGHTAASRPQAKGWRRGAERHHPKLRPGLSQKTPLGSTRRVPARGTRGMGPIRARAAGGRFCSRCRTGQRAGRKGRDRGPRC